MLTKGEKAVLERMANGEELVESIPGGWWLDSQKVAGRIGWSLLRKVLISEIDSEGEKFTRYYINEWGRNALAPNTAGGACTCREPKMRWKESSGWYCGVCYKPPRK